MNGPPENLYSQRNIHLVNLYYEKWFKASTNRSMAPVFEPITADLRNLKNGITISYNEDGVLKETLVRGSLIYCSHDNMAARKMFGMASCSCSYPCQICFATKDEMQSLYAEDKTLLRRDFYEHLGGRSYYDGDLKASKGIKERMPFADLKYYDPGEAMSQDLLHDLDEDFFNVPQSFLAISNRIPVIFLGTDKRILNGAFKSIIHAGRLTKAQITSRAAVFDYGPLDNAYAPRTLNLDKESLNLSAVQTRNLLCRFLFIYGNLEDETLKNI